MDKILVSRGLVKSRELAKAFIMEGKVFVEGNKITKAGTLVSDTAEISLREGVMPYVSRGGIKLEAAIDFFSIDVTGKIIMDVGSGTGGFTDCLLKKGAQKVYCIDVGYGQLAWPLRKDQRVVLMERLNVRYLDRIVRDQEQRFMGTEFEDLRKTNIDMATLDVSFISLTKVMPAVLGFIKAEGKILALVKPQFEVGKGEVGKGGIVREEEKRLKAVENIRKELESLSLRTMGVFQSPLPGRSGNIEYFLYMTKLTAKSY
ncbi:MAG TPA: TlyA family RNA methyltransferase [Thermodesulfovibrionales bacterium]|nr:TlyA family RNA methyltransferase [Thermodesulfovibrionales bacterium]